MKKLLLMLSVAAFVSTAVVAQEQPAPPQTKQSHDDWEKTLKAELKLTPEQTVKFDALSQEYSAKSEAITKDASLDANAQKEKKMALKKEKETKLFEFLTPEQQTKYKELVAKKKEAMKQQPSGQ